MKTQTFICIVVFCLTTIICQAQIRDNINLNLVDLKSVKIQEFDQINWQSDYKISEEGKPELPVYRVSYVLPINAKVTGVTFQSQEKHLLKRDVYIYPSQPLLPVGYAEETDFTQPDKKIYDLDIPYPGKLYDIESDDIIQGYHVVTLRIYPFEYIPKSRILNYYPNLEYTIEYESVMNPDMIRPTTQSVLRAELCEKLIRSWVKNTSDIDKFGSNVQSLIRGQQIIQKNISTLRSQSVSVLDEQVPDYIIITCDSLKSAFQALADWKMKKNSCKNDYCGGNLFMYEK